MGRARVKSLGDSDSRRGAWQLHRGRPLRAQPDDIDLGLKYRYFRTGKLNFIGDDVFAIDGNPNNVPGSATRRSMSVQTVDALAFADAEQRFRFRTACWPA